MIQFKMNISARSALTEIIETAYRNIPADLLPVFFMDQVIGHVSPGIFFALQHFIQQEDQDLQLIHCANQKILITQAPPYQLSIELRILAEYLKDTQLIHGWRDEDFSFIDEHQLERFRVERTFFRSMGFHSRAVHVNGFQAEGKVWIARRSHTKQIDPGRLDNITAGGLSANETLFNCVIRELWEEAGINAEQSLHINPMSSVTIRRGINDGSLHHETLYTYDLELPENFQPQNQDNEVSEFYLFDYEEALHHVLTEQFTIDAGVVTADFLLRHC